MKLLVSLFRDQVHPDGEGRTWQPSLPTQQPLSQNMFYLHSMREFSSVLVVWVLNVVIGVVLIMHWIDIMFINALPMFIVLPLCISVLCFLLGPMTFVKLATSRYPDERFIQTSLFSALEYVVCWGSCISFNLVIFITLTRGKCDDLSSALNDCLEGVIFPIDAVASQLFLPSIIYFSFPLFRCWKILVVQVISAVSALVSLFFTHHGHKFTTVTVCCIFFSSFTFYLRRHQLKLDYLVYRGCRDYEVNFTKKLRGMVSGVAHDLKSPVAALVLGLETLEEMLNDAEGMSRPGTESQKDYRKFCMEFLRDVQSVLGVMQVAKKAMLTTINRCVDFNQASSGLALVPNLQTTSIAAAVDNAVEQATYNKGIGISLHKEYDINILRLMATTDIVTDPLWLSENIACLLSNAMKFSDGDHSVVMLHISQTTCENKSFIKFCVIDEGLGVNERVKNNLFSYLGNDMQVHTGGAGLGLYTLASRVQSLKGRYGYEQNCYPRCSRSQRNKAYFVSDMISSGQESNEKPHGSVFWFEIPLQVSVSCHSSPASNFAVLSTRGFTASISNRGRSIQRQYCADHRSIHVPATSVKSVISARLPTHVAGSISERIHDKRPISASSTSSAVPLPFYSLTTGPSFASVPTPKHYRGAPQSPKKTASPSNDKSKSSVACSSDKAICCGDKPGESKEDVNASSLENDASILTQETIPKIPLGEQMKLAPLVITTTTVQTTTSTSTYAFQEKQAPDASPVRTTTSLTAKNGNKITTPSATVVSGVTPTNEKEFRSQYHLLVVDDSLAIRKMCSMSLQKQGYQVSSAVNGKEALCMMTAWLNSQMNGCVSSDVPPVLFDLVLMDIQMPVMDGVEAISLYREAETQYNLYILGARNAAAGRTISPTVMEADIENNAINVGSSEELTLLYLPILVMSACSDAEIIAQAMSAGATCFVPKPFTISQFHDITHELGLLRVD